VKLKKVSDRKEYLELIFGGEGHTFLNLLQSFLLSNEDVEMAGYSKPHPLMDRSILQLKMKGRKTYKKALLTASDDARKKLKEFLSKFEKQVEKQRS